MSSLLGSMLGDEKLGSGLFNTILNSLPFESRVSGYNFLGPGVQHK